MLRDQHFLQETPSPQTWQRIERRLDLHDRRRRQSRIVRLLGLAAGITAIGFSSGLLQIGVGQDYRNGTFHLETLSSAENDPQALMAIKFQRDLTAQMQGIQEGVPGKKFR